MSNNYKTNNYKTISEENSECLLKGICSINPTLSSLHEIILLYLKGLSFYLLKLKELGVTNESYKDIIISAFFNIITSAEYNQEQFHEIIVKLYDSILQSKSLYEKTCQERNIDIQTLKAYFKYSKNFDLSEAIRKGEKYFLKKSQSLTPKQKDLYDIMLFLGKGIGIILIELQRLGKFNENAYYVLLSLLNTEAPKDFSEEKVKQQIKKVMGVYYDVAKTLFETKIELYGKITPTEVSFSTEPGKAILVSGSDFKQLEMVLKAVENTQIGVYTHGIEILLSHAFPKFRSHPNLKGHFGSGLESSLIDFATFPGAILMSKGSLQKIEYLYRGRLFTIDPVPPLGIIKIKDYDFAPLIKSALDAKGFSKAQQKPPIRVGFDEKEINKKINNIVDKILKKEIKHLYIMGLLNFPNTNKEYFQNFFELLPKDCFAISFFYPINQENAVYLDSIYNYVLFYKILEKIDEKIPFKKINMSIFLTRCDKYTIINLLYLKHIGVKNVYMCKCPPTLINPSLMKTLQETFEIKEFSDPQKDIQETLAK